MSTSLLDGNWFTEIEKHNASAFSLQIKNKLHEENTPYQQIAIYSTEKIGRLMTINGVAVLTEKDSFISHEMLSHPALFAHAHPQKIAILGNGECGILKEVLKHSNIKEVWQIEKDQRITQLAEKYFPMLCEGNHDPRVHFHFGNGADWLAQHEAYFDVLIVTPTTHLTTELFQQYIKALRDDGILLQQSTSPFQLETLKSTLQHIKAAGFHDIHCLTFTQPTLLSSWRSAFMAKKYGVFKRIREKDIFNKTFATRYYNLDVHKAALVLPEFMREELT